MGYSTKRQKRPAKRTITKPTRKIKSKMFVIYCFLTIMLVALAGRLIQLQVMQHEEWESRAIDQLLSDTAIEPKRGTVYDRNMTVLAQSADVWMMTIDPMGFRLKPEVEEGKKLPAKKDWPLDENKVTQFAAKLEELLGISPEKFKKACLRNSQYEIIAKKVEKPERDAIKAYMDLLKKPVADGGQGIAITGVNFTVNNKRYYAYDNLAASIIGFVNDNGVGASGIEAKYENILKGIPGRTVVAKNGNNKSLPFTYEKTIDEQQGSNLVLSIDTSIQTKLEKHLKQAIADNAVQNKATGIVMDVETGEILAMATMPDYNLNEPYVLVNEALAVQIEKMPASTPEEIKAKQKAKGDAQEQQWRNKAISDTYHPGSVFKPVTVSMALEEGTVSLNSTFHCPGYIKVGNRTINCHKTSGHGSETLVEGMKNSCNPVFIGMGLNVGIHTFSEYFSAFGLNEATGIDLPGEASGIYYPESKMKQIDLATAAFGQSFTVTPIQMITAMSVVANGGYLVQPHIVSRIIDDDGNIIEAKNSNIKRQVISQQTAKTVCDMLEKVVSEGTGKNAYVEGYRIAGKTGTSEKLNNKEYVASFCGFAPADNPKVAVLVMLDEPKGASHMGGAIAAPVVKEIMADILPLLGVDPVYSDKDMQNKNLATPNVLNTKIEDAVATVRKNGLKERIIGGGKTVVRQVPAQGNQIPAGGTVILYTNGAENRMTKVPNFIGLTPSEANIAAANAGLNISFSGTDYESVGVKVRTQNIKEGTSVEQGTVIIVEFVHTENVE